ncbi:MAG: DMT family transporter [Burkholderiaceae bacterium]
MTAERSPLLLATTLMVGAAFLAAADSIIVRILTQDLHPFVIVFFRSLFGLTVVLPWIRKKPSVLKTEYSFLHLLRAGLKMLSFTAFFAAIASASLADVMAIAFTTPIFLTIGAWIFLGEQPVTRRVVAVVVSFAGMLLILRPGDGELSGALLLALFGAILAAIIQLLLKRMSAHDATDTLVAWNLILTVPLASLPLWWFWTPPDMAQLALLFIQGAAGALTMSMITWALSLAPASYIAPIDFLRLPAVAVMAYLFFGEVPAGTTVAGAIVIFSAILVLASRKEANALQREQVPPI